MKKAFTLIEMMVTMAILIIIFTLVAVMMTHIFKGFAVATDVSSVQNDAITLNEVYKDRVYYATGIEILPSVPSVGEEDVYYIYSDLVTDSVMYRMENDIPEKLYSGITGSQQVLFSKVDDRTIKSIFTVEEDDVSYNLDSEVSLQNGVGGDGITEDPSIAGMSGSCIAFTFKYIGTDETVVSPLILESYVFEKANNTASQMGFTEDYDAKVDQAKRTISVNFPFSEPTDQTVETFWPKATVDVNLGTDFLTIDKLADETKYYRSSLDSVRIKDYPAMNYINPRKVFIQSNDGRSKMYTVNATYNLDILEAVNMSVVPTKDGVSPTNTNNVIIRNNVYMPTDESTLNAVFGVKNETGIQENGYYFEWYAVDTEEQIKAFNLETAQNYEQYKVYSAQNDRKFKITEENRKDVVGKYVFYRIAPIINGSVDETFSSSIEGNITLTNNIDDRTPYVYITLDYGKMWETTLNEIDFDYGGTFQQNSSRNSYLKSPTFQATYEVDPGSDMKYEGVELRLYNLSNYKFNTINSDTRDVPRAGFDPYDKYEKKGGLYYTVDLVNKDLNIKGKRAIEYSLPNWVTGDKFLTMSRPGILSIPQYDNFYTDRRPADYNRYNNGYNIDSGIRIGIKHDKPSTSLGGFGISPNTKVTYLNSGIIYNYPAGGGNGGYFYDFVYKRGPNEEPGIKAVELLDSGYVNAVDSVDYSGKNVLVNNITKNPSPNKNIGGVTPYLFSSISNDDFIMDPTKAQDLLIDIHYTKARPTVNFPSFTYYQHQSLVTFNISDKDGNYANPAYFGAFFPNRFYMKDYEENEHMSGGEDKGLYILNQNEKIRGSDNTDSASGTYAANNIDILENRHFVLTAWSYVNNPNGNVSSQVTDEMDFTITEFTKLEQRDPVEPPPPVFIDIDRNGKYSSKVDKTVDPLSIQGTYTTVYDGDLVFSKNADVSTPANKIQTRNGKYDIIFQTGAKVRFTQNIVLGSEVQPPSQNWDKYGVQNVIIQDYVTLEADGYFRIQQHNEELKIGKRTKITAKDDIRFMGVIGIKRSPNITIGNYTTIESKKSLYVSPGNFVNTKNINIGENVTLKAAQNLIIRTEGDINIGKNSSIQQSGTGTYGLELTASNISAEPGSEITAKGAGRLSTTSNNLSSSNTGIYLFGPGNYLPLESVNLDGAKVDSNGLGHLSINTKTFNMKNSSTLHAWARDLTIDTIDATITDSEISITPIYLLGYILEARLSITGRELGVIQITNSKIINDIQLLETASKVAASEKIFIGKNRNETKEVYILDGTYIECGYASIAISARDKIKIAGTREKPVKTFSGDILYGPEYLSGTRLYTHPNKVVALGNSGANSVQNIDIVSEYFNAPIQIVCADPNEEIIFDTTDGAKVNATPTTVTIFDIVAKLYYLN